MDANPLLRTRAPPVADKARVEQVQRSAMDAGLRAKDIRRAPQTRATLAAESGHYNRSPAENIRKYYTPAGVMEW